MQDPAVAQSLIPHTKEFVTFVKTLYGLLASLSAALPLITAALKALPVARAKREKPPGLLRIPPALVLAASSAFTVFVLLQVVASREIIQRMSLGRIQVYAFLLFLLGCACLWMYMSLYYRVTLGRPKPVQPNQPDPVAGYATRDMVLLILHMVAFSALTLAFTSILYKLFLSQAVTKT